MEIVIYRFQKMDHIALKGAGIPFDVTNESALVGSKASQFECPGTGDAFDDEQCIHIPVW